MLRKNDQEFVIHSDRLVNAMFEFVSDFQIFRGIPAAHAFGLQVGIEAFDKLLVLAGIANKARVVLDGVVNQGAGIGNEGIGEAGLAQEGLGDVSFRPQERICPNGRRAMMVYCFQSFHGSQVNISKDCPSYIGAAEIDPAEVGTAEVGSFETGSAKVGTAEISSCEVSHVEVGFSEDSSVEDSSVEDSSVESSPAEVGFNEVGSAEVGSAEVGIGEVGSSKIRVHIWTLCSPCIPVFYSFPEKIKLLLVCHRIVHLLCGALIIERCRLMRKIISFCFFLPGSYGVFMMVYMLCSWKLGVSTLVLEVFHGVDES